MRKKAILAEGGGALRWTATWGVALALGAGPAAAQTFTVDEAFGDAGVAIAAAATEGEEMQVTVTVRARVEPPADPADDQAALRTVTAELRLRLFYSGEDGYDAAKQAESSDFAFHETDAEQRIEFPDDTEGAFVEVSAEYTVYTVNDRDAEDEVFKATVRLTGAVDGAREKTAIIFDDETQRYVLTLGTERPTEGAPIEATLAARPAHEDGASRTSVKLRVDTPGYRLDARSHDGVRIGNDSVPGVSASHTVTIEPPDNDGNRRPDTVTLRAFLGTEGNLVEQDALAITVADLHGLPAVEATVVGDGGRALDPQPDSVKEGETVRVKLTSVDEDGNALAFGEELSVSLTPAGTADAGDYRLSTHPVDIAADGESATVDLTVRENEEVGSKTLVLDAEVAGERAYGSETITSPAILSLAIEDTTTRLVRAKPEGDVDAALAAAMGAAMGGHGLNPGEDFDLTGTDLFEAAEGVTVWYAATSDDESVAGVSTGDDAITVMPLAEGAARITVTATAVSNASGVEIIEQTEANVARIRFPVDVVQAPPTFSLSAENTDIVEGESATLTMTASRPVDADTEVTFVRDAASSAGDDDYELDPMTVAIEAGQTSGQTLVSAIEDETAEEDEVLTLFAVVDGVQMPDVSVSFDLQDVPLPPPTFSLSAENTDIVEGESATLTVTASRPVDADTEVTLVRAAASSAGDDDYELDPMTVAIEAGQTSGQTLVSAIEDDRAEGDEVLTLFAVVDGVQMPDVSVSFDLQDVPLPPPTFSLSAEDTEIVEGESATLTVTASRPVDADTEVTLMRDAASSAGDDDYELDPMTVAIEAGQTSGQTLVSAIEDETAEEDEVLTLFAVVDGVQMPDAAVSFNLRDVPLPPPTFSLSAEDTDIVEGASATLTVTASRPVDADTEVTFGRDAASSAGDDDYRLDPMTVAIGAGQTSGQTLVRAIEDETAEEAEVLTLFAVVDGVQMPDVSVSFNLWDATVPALPLVASLLLAAFLALDACRRRARRQLRN